jgi:hypothetical protein
MFPFEKVPDVIVFMPRLLIIAFDALEADKELSLRIMTLTDETESLPL